MNNKVLHLTLIVFLFNSYIYSADLKNEIATLTRNQERQFFVDEMRGNRSSNRTVQLLSQHTKNEIFDCYGEIISIDIDCMLRDHKVNTGTCFLSEIKNTEGNNPFHIIAQHGKIEHALVVPTLFYGSLLYQKNNVGKTPIDLAREHNTPEVVSALNDTLQEHIETEKRYDDADEWDNTDYDNEDYKLFFPPWEKPYKL